MRGRIRKLLLFIRFAALAVFFTTAAAFLFFMYSYVSYHLGAPPGNYSHGRNAVWAGHRWVGLSYGREDYRRLADLLRSNRISDAFFHVGPLDADGRIPAAKYLYARRMIRNVRELYPGLCAQAWIGQVEKRGGGPLDISNPEVRKNIVRTASRFLDLGFCGIHYDIEPIYSGNAYFLALLDETRKVAGDRSAVVSVSSPALELLPGKQRVLRFFSKRSAFWKKKYFIEVAARCDQISVMMYDTALPEEWLYAKIVEWETANLLDLLGGRTTLFIGVPSYDEERRSFHPRAENVRSGLRGVKKGLAHYRLRPAPRFGPAVYALWTTSDEEWKTYRLEWLGEKK
jgi:hypothetical protein